MDEELDSVGEEIARLERQRAQRRADNSAKERAQYAEDLRAVDAIEATTDGPFATVKVGRYQHGHPTLVFLRKPSALEYKRFGQTSRRAHDDRKIEGKQRALEDLGAVCTLYPAEDAAKALWSAFPGLLQVVGQAAAALAEGSREEEGKG